MNRIAVFGLIFVVAGLPMVMTLFTVNAQAPPTPIPWYIETIDSSGIVGPWYPSIALDSSDRPHISYCDYTNNDLKYARWTGSTWSIETVDSAGYIGEYPSIALDSGDRPHISYYDSIPNYDLKYARWTGSTWSIQVVDSAGNVGYDTSIALDSGDKPHISYCDVANYDLKYARWTGSTWSIETVDSAGSVGLYTSIALDSGDKPHISYFDYTNHDLKYARWTGSTWSIETVDSAGSVGEGTSIALDSGDKPHISYHTQTNVDLKYARWTGSTWSIETVDSAGSVGYYPSIALDSGDKPHISYCDFTNYDLKYARWTGSTWSIETVDSAGDVGEYPSIALDSGDKPHICYYDYTNSNLKYALGDWTAPTTSHDYDGSWHSTNFIINLTAHDDSDRVNAAYYKINNDPNTKNVSANGQPLITTENASNTLEYWSIDKAGNEELPHKILTGIKLDKTIPIGSIKIAGNATYTNSTSTTLTLSATDVTSGPAKMCFSNNNTTWSSWEAYATSKAWTLQPGDGTKTVYYQIKDNAGLNSTVESDTIVLDTTPPTGSITIVQGATYTNSSSVTLTLSAHDTTSGIAQMRFSNNNATWTLWEAYATSKTWTLAPGDGNKAVYVEFRDNAGCTSSHKNFIILDTLPPSIALTTSLTNGTEIKSSTYEISWTATDAGYGLDHYEVKLDSGTWSDLGALTTYTFTGLSDGTHTFNIKASDKTGKSRIYSVDVVINTSPILGPGYLEEALIGGAIGAAVVGAVVYKIRKRPKKPPTPAQLKVTAQPARILADGESKSTITIQLLDKKAQPIAALADTQIKITTTRGKLEKPIVTIPKGKDTEKTVITSSTESGPVTVSANAEGLRSIGITLNFIEKKRFCMHCGFLMPYKAKTCSDCGKAPPAGVDTKMCKNCKSVIPAVAKFCSECGAGQSD